jgi:uncharacterized protein (DUF4415 family)
VSKRPTSKVSRTDWKRVDSTRDVDIDYSDIPRITLEQFAKAVIRKGMAAPAAKEQVTLRLDADVLEWFRARGKGYQTQINALLRAYMQAHASSKRDAR